MTPTIRPAEASDAFAVLELWRDADAAPSHTDDVESLMQLLGHDPEALIVADCDGRIVGSVIAAWDGWRGSVYRLAVAPDHRRRGLGQRLVLKAEERLAEVGAVRLQAVVVESDRGATGFWRANGWEQQVDRLRFVKG
jgi:ribosomal protein S18 acetylase RimI-like enzyme